MKKFILSTVIMISFLSSLIAQKDEPVEERDYKDLLTLFVTEKYDKVVMRATKYTEDEKTKKDPLPYLFLSMSYFEISKKDEYKTRFPDAFKLCLKNIKSYASKDKERRYAAEYEDFFSKLRNSIVSEGELMLDQQKYTKAKTMFQALLNIDENDAGAKIYLGITMLAMKSKKEAETEFGEAKKLLQDKKAAHGTKELDDLLKNGLMTYATQLSSDGNKSVAKEWMDLGMEYFKDDKEYKVTYETIAD